MRISTKGRVCAKGLSCVKTLPGNHRHTKMVMVLAKANSKKCAHLLTFDILPKALFTKDPKSNPMTKITCRRVLTNALMVALLAFGASCNKEKPTTAIITVQDVDGKPVEGVTVRLFANPAVPLADATRLLKETLTSVNGKAEFDYTDFYEQGQAGFAVLDISAIKDTMFAEGIIKILEEETNEQTLVLEPVIP